MSGSIRRMRPISRCPEGLMNRYPIAYPAETLSARAAGPQGDVACGGRSQIYVMLGAIAPTPPRKSSRRPLRESPHGLFGSVLPAR